MNKKIIFVFILCFNLLFASENEYDFSIFDGTLNSYTMNQMNTNYLSISRLVNRGVEEIFSDDSFLKIKVSDWINYTWPFFTFAVTHEEGHRSILTNANIGSISQPFFNTKGAAYVKGVTDESLKFLKNNDNSSFVRMYTAGIESDYLMTKAEEEMIAFETEKMSILFPDYLLRKISIYGYLGIGTSYKAAELGSEYHKWFVSTVLNNLKEENNEYERDIAGFDPFGAVYSLFGEKEFKRYVTYSDLSEEEKEYINKIGFRDCFFNILSPFLFYKPYFNIGEKFLFNFSVGEILIPFGDQTELNLYLKYKSNTLSDLNFAIYLRKCQNFNKRFPSFGIKIIDFSPIEWFSVTIGGYIWWQPEKLDFYTSDSFTGGAIEIQTRWMLPTQYIGGKNMFVKNAGFNFGCLYKTYGFMPGIEQHDKHFRFNLGLSLEI